MSLRYENGKSSMTSRDRILAVLRSGPKTSWQLCQMAKTADYRRRIYELRQIGYEITVKKVVEKIENKVVVHHLWTLIAEPKPVSKVRVIEAKGQMGLL